MAGPAAWQAEEFVMRRRIVKAAAGCTVVVALIAAVNADSISRYMRMRCM